jgi:hypothetical protein
MVRIGEHLLRPPLFDDEASIREDDAVGRLTGDDDALLLAAHGIAMLPGSKYAARPTEPVRVATAILAEGHECVADVLIKAAQLGEA